jgi:hypothetical protein
MSNRCDICIEEQCEGERNCDCDLCNSQRDCNKYLRPTIRITTRCTQACSHCCFECSPKTNDVMSMEVAHQITQFLKVNKVTVLNVMGGEFFLHPEWFELLQLFSSVSERIRLVTNGDWAGMSVGRDVTNKIATVKNVYVAISNDQWHTNAHVDAAARLLTEADAAHLIQGDDEKDPMFGPVVPVGRSRFDAGTFFTSFGCYCSKPDTMYSFLIDEVGTIFKCPFGVWDYADVFEFQEGGFRDVFKTIHRRFYTTFISSCRSCTRAYESHNREKKVNVA